ncbi:MAG: hypothetical protein ACI9YT_000149 [Halobacteriales archaeon]|jgi:hypothetical protein
MDESALQHRLDVIERRQVLIVSLVVVAYVLAALWFLVAEVEAVSGWTAGIGATILAVLAAVVGMYRRRQP